jgi:TRAP-type C4-dicarboxylate transport system permease small subunit
MMDILHKLSSSLNKLLLMLGAVVLCLMMALATCNMIFGFLGQPIKGAYEVTGFLGALAACLAVAPTQQLRGHIAVTIFDRFIPRRARQVLNFITQVLLVGFVVLIIRQLFLLALSLRIFGELSESLRLPFYPLIFIMAFGFGALVLTLTVQMLGREKR